MFVKIVQNSHETLVLESLSNDDAGLQLYQKETPTKVLSSEFPEMLKKMFLQNTSERPRTSEKITYQCLIKSFKNTCE